MTARVKCPSCGAGNELMVDRLYCRRCGAKLDLSRARFGPEGGQTVAVFIMRFLRVAILCLLLAVLALLLWPTAPQGAPGTEEEGMTCFDKLADLYAAINDNRPLYRILNEAEVNGYFGLLLAEATEAQASSGLGMDVRSINLSFTENTFIVHILAEWKIVRLTCKIEGRPRLDDARFEVEVLQLSLGHLPIPGPFRQRFSERLLPLFEQMERERYVLDHVARIDLAPQRVRLITGL